MEVRDLQLAKILYIFCTFVKAPSENVIELKEEQ
jgi:hypothetical protein